MALSSRVCNHYNFIFLMETINRKYSHGSVFLTCTAGSKFSKELNELDTALEPIVQYAAQSHTDVLNLW